MHKAKARSRVLAVRVCKSPGPRLTLPAADRCLFLRIVLLALHLPLAIIVEGYALCCTVDTHPHFGLRYFDFFIVARKKRGRGLPQLAGTILVPIAIARTQIVILPRALENVQDIMTCFKSTFWDGFYYPLVRISRTFGMP